LFGWVFDFVHNLRLSISVSENRLFPVLKKRIRFKDPSDQVSSKLLKEPSVFMSDPPVRDWQFQRQFLHLNVFSTVLRTAVVYQKRVDVEPRFSKLCEKEKKQITGHKTFGHSIFTSTPIP
jgi:hypothetical protein